MCVEYTQMIHCKHVQMKHAVQKDVQCVGLAIRKSACELIFICDNYLDITKESGLVVGVARHCANNHYHKLCGNIHVQIHQWLKLFGWYVVKRREFILSEANDHTASMSVHKSVLCSP